MSRILIGGWPRVGKTFLATKLGAELGIPVRHADDLIGTHAWSEASAEVARWMAEGGPWIIEGVATVRAVRKALAAFSDAPADLLYWSATPREELSVGQITMGKGCDTVWAGIRAELVRRGTRVEIF